MRAFGLRYFSENALSFDHRIPSRQSRAMCSISTRCLILACGNTLRGDDGVGPWLAAWAEDRFRATPSVRVLCRQQWTPELAEELASAESVLFIDASAASPAGSVLLSSLQPAGGYPSPATHSFGAAELLALAHELYAARPRAALLLAVGAASFDLREGLSAPLQAALPRACRLIEETVLRLLDGEAPWLPEHRPAH